MSAFEVFFWLIFAHAVADYPLQGDFLAKAKNHKNPVPGITPLVALFMHSMIHAGFVAMITGSIILGCLELICHMWIDWMKCDGILEDMSISPFNYDQLLHVWCKGAWASVYLLMLK